MTEEALAALPEAERALYENVPAWATGAGATVAFVVVITFYLITS